jgi:heat-inducible transcriptional repressor
MVAMETPLDARKEQVLAAVVEAYIEQAAPVGSKTVVKRGLKASSATVRHEMAELEQLGLLEQPHASAGRMPSGRGLRYYVERLLERRRMLDEDKAEVDSFCGREFANVQDTVTHLAALLSAVSHNVGMVMVRPVERAPLKALHFIELGRDRIKIVLQFADGGLEERVIKNQWGLDAVTLGKLTNLVSLIAPGRNLTALRRELIRQMEETRSQARGLLARAAEISDQLLRTQEPELFIHGQANLLDLPEFAGAGPLRDLLRDLEEKKLLGEMLDQLSMMAGLRVIIGSENKIESLQRCSIIASTYGRHDMPVGAVGVIGPTRMNYARLIPLVIYASGRIAERLNR